MLKCVQNKRKKTLLFLFFGENKFDLNYKKVKNNIEKKIILSSNLLISKMKIASIGV